MDESIRTAAISPLPQRLIYDMNMRRFQIEQRDAGVRRHSGTALRFFFTPHHRPA